MPGPIESTQFSDAPGEWSLRRAAPDTSLAGIVKEFWEVEGALRPFRETLLPNGCVEVMINLGPPHRVLSDAGTGVWERGWFSGLHERALVIESLAGTHLLSARLHPLGAARILGRKVAAAANGIVDLEVFLGADGARLRENARIATSQEERFLILESYLQRQLNSQDAIPEFVSSAGEIIERDHGSLRVADLHKVVGVSRKHLAVSFTRYVGMSTKAYAKIQRFIWTLARLQQSTSVAWSNLAAEAGYSDQSHLVRDFQRIGAASPTDYLRRRAPDGSALLYDAV